MMTDITLKKNLNPCRRHRTYPRVTRRTRHSPYRMKKRGDTGTRHDGPATIEIITRIPAGAAA
jgi:hypothetical protein